MTKVYLWYKDIRYGYLTQQKGKYVWTPDVATLDSLDPVYKFALNLPFKKTVFDRVPPRFDAFAYTSRADLVEKAKIFPTDTPFERLVKFATLPFTRLDYYVTLSDVYSPR